MRFADYGKRVVFAAFDGGEITSDAGVLLLREQARRILDPLCTVALAAAPKGCPDMGE